MVNRYALSYLIINFNTLMHIGKRGHTYLAKPVAKSSRFI